MSKTKNTLIFGLIITTAFALALGLLYWRDTIVPDDDVFIGEPPGFWDNLMESPDTDGDISVFWYQVENATSYDLYRKVDGGSWQLIAQVAHNPSRSYGFIFDRDLLNGRYSYKIQSIYINGVSHFSYSVFVDVQLEI